MEQLLVHSQCDFVRGLWLPQDHLHPSHRPGAKTSGLVVTMALVSVTTALVTSEGTYPIFLLAIYYL
jgi:hypothetical protein